MTPTSLNSPDSFCKQWEPVSRMFHATGLWHVQPMSVYLHGLVAQAHQVSPGNISVQYTKWQSSSSNTQLHWATARLQGAVPCTTTILFQRAAHRLLLAQHIAHPWANSSSETTVLSTLRDVSPSVCVHLSVNRVYYVYLPWWCPLQSWPKSGLPTFQLLAHELLPETNSSNNK